MVYIHVKDAYAVNGNVRYCLCGEGGGHAESILRDLLLGGYDGVISIQPHLASVIHADECTKTVGRNVLHLYRVREAMNGSDRSSTT